MTGGAEHPAEPTPWLFGLIVAVACAVFATLVLIGLYDLVGNAQRWLGLVAVAVVAVTGALTLMPRWAGAARSAPTVTAVEASSETGLDELFGADEPAELETPDEDVDDRA